jgi:hypothetical protein
MARVREWRHLTNVHGRSIDLSIGLSEHRVQMRCCVPQRHKFCGLPDKPCDRSDEPGTAGSGRGGIVSEAVWMGGLPGVYDDEDAEATTVLRVT